MNDLSSWSFAGTERRPRCAGGCGEGQLREAESTRKEQQSGSLSSVPRPPPSAGTTPRASRNFIRLSLHTDLQ